MLKTKPQPGTKIRCTDTGGYSFLTRGKIYEVVKSINDTLNCFFFTDDDGDEMGHWLNKMETEEFELVQEGNEMKNEVTETRQDEFQVGDVVWCVISGKGKVKAVFSDGREYPLYVVFDSGDYNYYTLDGKYLEKGNRSLFFSEPKVEGAVTRPFVSMLVGKKVVVRYFDGTCSSPLKITDENESMLWYDDNCSVYKSGLTAIYEVQSENLLKK